MGQTLTHGVYLPDEGERNCYSGLAANWQILDGSVGTIAAHTAALAGKAPLVHTHTKSDITDFPAYGNAAGTICEGNDSRLSDARTPVAHTHTKSDVTDLLNSNFIPSANNSYDLGSSSYQWNNLYAKNYYYNGTAWGLDQANVWTQNQVIASSNDKCYFVKDTIYELGQSYSNGEHVGGLTIHDKNGATVGLLDIVDRSYGNMEMRIRVQQKFDPNSNNRSTSGNILFNEIRLGITPIKTNYIGFNADLWGGNTYNLGTSTNKWKTLNGINPGALSLPVTALNNTYDISGNITDLTGGNNAITAARTGWIFVKSDNATEISIANTTTGMGASDHSASATTLMVSIPVTSGETLNIIANCTSIDKAYLLPCQGNV